MAISALCDRPLSWDIFCQVIDNWGDIGVCWRLCQQLQAQGHTVRLWLDDDSALSWMNSQSDQSIEIRAWPHSDRTEVPFNITPHDVVIEAFGCALPDVFLQAIAQRAQAPVWINLEYLSAEAYVEASHSLPSPVLSGPACGLKKWFYYPGFTKGTGGLLREPDLLQQQQQFDRTAWRRQYAKHLPQNALWLSLFSYEPQQLPTLLQQCAQAPHHLLVTPGRSAAAVQKALTDTGLAPSPSYPQLPYTDQQGFDEMLWACDVNFVRGEDSWVRAIWADRPFIWQIYPQQDQAHHAKLEAFLDWLDAPNSLRHYHRLWNDITQGKLPDLTPTLLAQWQPCFSAARQRLIEQTDLVSGLLAFIKNCP